LSRISTSSGEVKLDYKDTLNLLLPLVVLLYLLLHVGDHLLILSDGELLHLLFNLHALQLREALVQLELKLSKLG